MKESRLSKGKSRRYLLAMALIFTVVLVSYMLTYSVILADMVLTRYYSSRTLSSISISTWHSELQQAFYTSKLQNMMSLVPYEMNCWPHYPFYGLPDLNFQNGTKALCD